MNYAVYCASATYGFPGFYHLEPSSEVSSYVSDYRAFFVEHFDRTDLLS